KKVDLNYQIKGMNQTMVQLLEANRQENEFLSQYRNRNKNKEIPLLVINNSYRTAARHFEVINSPTTSIIVPYDEGEEIIAELNGDPDVDNLSDLLRKSQRYSINVYPYQLDMLIENQSLTTLLDDQVYALKEGAYDLEYGLNIEGDSEQAFLAF